MEVISLVFSYALLSIIAIEITSYSINRHSWNNRVLESMVDDFEFKFFAMWVFFLLAFPLTCVKIINKSL